MDIFRILLLIIVVIGLVLFIEHERTGNLPIIPVAGGQGCTGSYVLQPGETLESIAQYCGYATSQIKNANKGRTDIDVNHPQPGDLLQLPADGAFPARFEPTQVPVPVDDGKIVYAGGHEYTVKGEDTLDSIARTEKTSVDEIRKLNLVLASDTHVYPGQVLLLP